MANTFRFRVARPRFVARLVAVGGLLGCAAFASPVRSAGADPQARVLLAQAGRADKDLSKALEKGDEAGVTAALDAGADANATDKRGQSALMLAAKQGQSSLVALLIARGAQVNLRDKDGQSALMLATQWGAPAPSSEKKKRLGGILGKLKDKAGSDLKTKMGSSLDARLSGLGKVGSALMGNVPLKEMLGENLDLLLAGKGLKLSSVSNWKAIVGTALLGDAQGGGSLGIVPMLSGDLRIMSAGDWSKLVQGVQKANPRVLSAVKTLDMEQSPATLKWAEFVGLAQGDNQQPMAKMIADPVLQPLLVQARTGLLGAVEGLPGQRMQTIVNGLLGAGADATLTDNNGRSALDMARERELNEIVALLEAPAPATVETEAVEIGATATE